MKKLSRLREKEKMKETEQQEWKNIELKEVKSSLKKLH